MEIFATGLSSPECPIILGNGDLLVVEMRQDRSAITRIDGLPIFRQLIVAGAPPACSRPPYRATPRSKEASS